MARVFNCLYMERQACLFKLANVIKFNFSLFCLIFYPFTFVFIVFSVHEDFPSHEFIRINL